MCRTTAAPLMAAVGMAGTAMGVALAALRLKMDERADKAAAEEAAEAERARMAEAEGRDAGA